MRLQFTIDIFADFHTVDCRPYEGCVKTSWYFLANIGEDLDAAGKAKLNLLTFVDIFDIGWPQLFVMKKV